MNRFLLGALAMGAVFVLTSFALSTRLSPAQPATGPAWTVSQYQLDRAFRTEFQHNTMPLSIQAPPTQGFIITQVKVSGGGLSMLATINGGHEHLDCGYGNGNLTTLDLNPPIIVRPGETFSITQTPGTSGPSVAFVTLAGYTTLPGET